MGNRLDADHVEMWWRVARRCCLALALILAALGVLAIIGLYQRGYIKLFRFYTSGVEVDYRGVDALALALAPSWMAAVLLLLLNRR